MNNDKNIHLFIRCGTYLQKYSPLWNKKKNHKSIRPTTTNNEIDYRKKIFEKKKPNVVFIYRKPAINMFYYISTFVHETEKKCTRTNLP